MRHSLVCVVMLWSLAGAAERNTAVIDDVAYTQSDRFVTVEPGRRLNIHCTGRGSPTVVFDSGLGDGTRVWGLIQPAVARRTRACSYDRAGLGFSDPPRRPSTSANLTDDLHRLLRAARVKPPYVLVGHSFGGMNVKLYAETWPDEVAGLVLVDPSHEDLGEGAWAIDPESRKSYPPYMAALKRCTEARPDEFVPGSAFVQDCGPFPSPRYSVAINAVELALGKQRARLQARLSEQENIWFTSADQLRSAYRLLGSVPIRVLTHEAFPRGAAETQQQRDEKNQLWLDLHGQIAAMSTRGERVTVANTGHYIQLEQPQVVVDSILEVLRVARER